MDRIADRQRRTIWRTVGSNVPWSADEALRDRFEAASSRRSRSRPARSATSEAARRRVCSSRRASRISARGASSSRFAPASSRSRLLAGLLALGLGAGPHRLDRLGELDLPLLGLGVGAGGRSLQPLRLLAGAQRVLLGPGGLGQEELGLHPGGGQRRPRRPHDVGVEPEPLGDATARAMRPAGPRVYPVGSARASRGRSRTEALVGALGLARPLLELGVVRRRQHQGAAWETSRPRNAWASAAPSTGSVPAAASSSSASERGVAGSRIASAGCAGGPENVDRLLLDRLLSPMSAEHLVEHRELRHRRGRPQAATGAAARPGRGSSARRSCRRCWPR